ncbi:hypothetical protein C2S52_003710 [Perilla frutescens var. hirtella]|nr:hypothetical protein C2S52_003710 [Perilla frutescens var. hirtella]
MRVGGDEARWRWVPSYRAAEDSGLTLGFCGEWRLGNRKERVMVGRRSAGCRLRARTAGCSLFTLHSSRFVDLGALLLFGFF